MGAPDYLSVVTRVTTGRILQHFPDEETDGAHVAGRSNTGCTDSNTFAKVRVAGSNPTVRSSSEPFLLFETS